MVVYTFYNIFKWSVDVPTDALFSYFLFSLPSTHHLGYPLMGNLCWFTRLKLHNDYTCDISKSITVPLFQYVRMFYGNDIGQNHVFLWNKDWRGWGTLGFDFWPFFQIIMSGAAVGFPSCSLTAPWNGQQVCLKVTGLLRSGVDSTEGQHLHP